MKTAIVGGIALALAGSSAWLAWQLHLERARSEQAEARVAQLEGVESRLKAVERERAVEHATAAATPVATPQPPAGAQQPPAAQSTPGSGVVAFNSEDSYQLRLSRSASSRALLRADKIERLRQQYPNLARVLGMSEAEAADFIGLLADQEQQRELAFARRRQNGGRDVGAQVAEQRRDLAQRLGDERLAKFDNYRKGLPDRSQVRSFRSRLSDADALSDSQAEELASALQDEREQYAKQVQADMGGNATFSMQSMSGFTLMTNIAPSNEDAQEKQLVDQIESYNKLAHDRASSLLSPNQLKAFEQFQQAQLTSQRLMIRSMRDTVPSK
jgi:hypothetical protein